MLSGIPHARVCATTLTFLDFVNDFPAIFQNFCLLFVDDLYTFAVVRNDGDARMLQNDLNEFDFLY